MLVAPVYLCVVYIFAVLCTYADNISFQLAVCDNTITLVWYAMLTCTKQVLALAHRVDVMKAQNKRLELKAATAIAMQVAATSASSVYRGHRRTRSAASSSISSPESSYRSPDEVLYLLFFLFGQALTTLHYTAVWYVRSILDQHVYLTTFALIVAY
jgi:hypothetical protein